MGSGYALDNSLILNTKIQAFLAGRFDLFGLSDVQHSAMVKLCDKKTREVDYGGAAGGGKSWLGCEWLLWSCLSYPGTRWAIGRFNLKQIRDSTIVTWRKVCKKHRVQEGKDWSYNDNTVHIKFANGSEVIGVQLQHKPNDVEYDAFGSMEFTGGWVEEAGGCPYKGYQALKSRLGRHLNDVFGIVAKLFVTFNPSRNWLYNKVYKPWSTGVERIGAVFIRAFATDNPYKDSGYMEQLNELEGAMRARLLAGEWDYDDDPLQLMEFDAISDLFTNSYVVPDAMRKRIVCDIAMHGSDLFRIGVFYGDVLVESFKMEKSGGKQVVNAIKALQAKHGIRAGHVLYDADAVGGFVGRTGGFIPGAYAFHGNSGPVMKKNAKERQSDFFNLKTQCAFLLAEKINEGQMWAACVKDEDEIELLSEELAHVKKAEITPDGKFRLMPKPKVVELLGRSPDFADLWVMVQVFSIIEGIRSPKKPRRVSSF